MIGSYQYIPLECHLYIQSHQLFDGPNIKAFLYKPWLLMTLDNKNSLCTLKIKAP